MDSGCSTHLCKNEEKFEEMNAVTHGKLNLASSASAEIRAKGNGKIVTKVGDAQKNVNLTEAMMNYTMSKRRNSTSFELRSSQTRILTSQKEL